MYLGDPTSECYLNHYGHNQGSLRGSSRTPFEVQPPTKYETTI